MKYESLSCKGSLLLAAKRMESAPKMLMIGPGSGHYKEKTPDQAL
jgi:hypothetical protein